MVETFYKKEWTCCRTQNIHQQLICAPFHETSRKLQFMKGLILTSKSGKIHCWSLDIFAWMVCVSCFCYKM